jgi:hypothetical protein
LPVGLALGTFNSLAAAACVDSPSGLVSWWRAENNASDFLGNNHGSLQSGLGFATGRVGQAFHFTLNGQEARVPASAILDVGAATEFTVETWINPADAANQLPILEWNNGTIGAHLWISVTFAGVGGPGCVYASIDNNPASAMASAPGLMTAGAWHHVALRYRVRFGFDEVKLFLNGVEVASKALDPTRPQTSYDLHIGARPGVLSFRGQIDEVSLYKRALTAAEIQALYDAGSAGKCLPVCAPFPSHPVSWWRMENNAMDSLGTNHGTLMAGLSFVPGLVGQSLNFVGSAQEVLVPASASLDGGRGRGLTVEAWINPTNITSQQPIAEWTDDPNGILGAHFWIAVNNAGFGGPGSLYATLEPGGTDTIVATGPDVVKANAWQHVAWSYDRESGFARLYLNGAEVAARNVGVRTPHTALPLHLGRRRNVGTFVGRMDDVLLYARALSATEIQAIYNAGALGKCTNHVVISGADCPDGGRDVSYFHAFGAVFGQPPYVFQLAAGSGPLPPGLSLSLSGEITGRPTAPGTYNFTVEVTDFGGGIAQRPATINIIAAPALAGLVSWWPADNHLLDFAGPNHGIAETAGNYGQGKAGQSFAFGVRAPASPSLNVGARTNCTLEAWIYPFSLTPAPVFEWHNGSASGGDLSLATAGTFSTPGALRGSLVRASGGGSVQSISLGNQVRSNAWQHVAMVARESAIELYLNGKRLFLSSQNASGFGAFLTTYDFHIGVRPPGTRFPGLIDEACIYNRALSSNEIAALYANGAAGKELPRLRILSSANGFAVLFWQSGFANYGLESSSAVGLSIWNPVAAPRTQSGNEWQVIVPRRPTPEFFRLRKP